MTAKKIKKLTRPIFRKQRLKYLKLFRKNRNKNLTEKLEFQQISNAAIVALIKSFDWPKICARCLVLFISSLWFAFFPIYLFVIYMAEKGFFSYDFFVSGIIGLRSFFFTVTALITASSFLFFGSIFIARYVYISYIRSGNISWEYRIYFYLLLLFGTSFHIKMILSSAYIGDFVIYESVATISFLLVAYGCTMIKVDKRENFTNWAPSAIFVGLTFLLPFFNSHNVAQLIDTGLKRFNVGSDKRVTIYDGKEGDLITEGNLLFWSPDFVYVTTRLDEKSFLHAYPTRNGTHIVIEK